MDLDTYRLFLDLLVTRASDDPDVVGVVALGSAAARSRAPDRWSDHDVWVVARDAASADRLRDDTGWLPHAERIVAHLVETRHGRSVIYDDGHLLELAVFEDDVLQIARANDHRVLYDAGGLEERMAAIAAAGGRSCRRTRSSVATPSRRCWRRSPPPGPPTCSTASTHTGASSSPSRNWRSAWRRP